GELRRAPLGRHVVPARPRAADVHEDQADGAADRRVRAEARPEAPRARVHAEGSRDRSVDDQQRRHWMGRRLDSVEVEGGLEHRLYGGDDDGKVRGLAPRHDGVDRELLERRLAPERRHRTEAPVRRRLAQHRAHALLGRRDDGQPVAPLALAEESEERFGGVYCNGVYGTGGREVGFNRGWRAGGARASDTPPFTGHGDAGPADQARELLDRLAGTARNRLRALTAERVLDDEERQSRDPEGAELTDGEALERGRPDQPRGRAGFRQLDCVVETPRRARPSVGRAREDDVARLRELGEELGRRGRRGVRLPPADDRPHPMLGGEERADLVRQPVEVRLGVVQEADDAALQRRRQRRHRHRLLRRHPDRAPDENACHPFLRVTTMERASSRPRFSSSSVRTERLIETWIDSTGSVLPTRWMTSVPVNSWARSSVDAKPLSVRTSQVSAMGAILPQWSSPSTSGPLPPARASTTPRAGPSQGGSVRSRTSPPSRGTAASSTTRPGCSRPSRRASTARLRGTRLPSGRSVSRPSGTGSSASTAAAIPRRRSTCGRTPAACRRP